MNEITNSKFFSGGHAIFTISNPSGEHYTFRIGHKNETQPLFVGLLTGPDNEHSYTYLGIYKPQQGWPFVHLTRSSKYTEDTKPVKVARWALAQIMKGNSLPDGYSVQHAGKCCCCGRTLTTPESVQNGIGPICAEKQGWGM